MKKLYLECNMGAAGDMIVAALWDLLPNKEEFLSHLQKIGVLHVTVDMIDVTKCGIAGKQFRVYYDGTEEITQDDPYKKEHHHKHDSHGTEHHQHDHPDESIHDHVHHHEHRSLTDIYKIVDDLAVSDMVKNHTKQIYQSIARAESKAHDCQVEEVHFHEVGAVDAIVDVLTACLLIEALDVDEICASPICVGYGHVVCAHGILPVPAPATAELLKGIPVYAGNIEGELCTPTGAAILRHFVSDFCDMPFMKIHQIGYGMGKKDFPKANCVRAFLGEENSSKDVVVELSCNIDDMTAEELAYATQELQKGPALDVYTTNIGMKKGRAGILLCVLCKEEKKNHIIQEIFRLTSTIGIREAKYQRYILERKEMEIETPFGVMRKKLSEGYGIQKEKWEAEDLMRALRDENVQI